jgi:hypothetical protein
MAKIGSATLGAIESKVQSAIAQGYAKPEWLERVRDGRLSYQDSNAAAKLWRRHVLPGALVGGLFGGLVGAVAGGKIGGLSGIGELSDLIEKGIKEQGFLATMAESLRDFGRRSVVKS